MPSLPRVEASSIGIDASLALALGTGTVIAVFARAFYVRLSDGPICIDNGTIGKGPLNLLCPALDDLDLRTVVRTGMTVETDATAIALPPPPNLPCRNRNLDAAACLSFRPAGNRFRPRRAPRRSSENAAGRWTWRTAALRRTTRDTRRAGRCRREPGPDGLARG